MAAASRVVATASSRAPCPACGDRRARRLESVDLDEQHAAYAPHDRELQRHLTDAARRAADGYQMHECAGCGLQFAWPLRNPGSRWYALAYRALRLYPAERWEFVHVGARLARGCRMLEIGCGEGHFLEECRARGIEAVGVDFSAEAIHRCRAKGLDAHALAVGADAALVAEDRGRFDAVAAFHVLEHLDDPAGFFRLAASATRPGAELHVSVPSDRRITRLYDERDFLDQPPHHLTRWTAAALHAIATVTGWRLDELAYEPLPARVALWSTAVRLPAYRAVAAAVQLRLAERALRWALYPRAALHLVRREAAPSGFSMVARFVRTS